MVLVYTMLTVIVLMAATSLAVDWGRVETAKTELQNATDAAVRYAVSGISDGTYSTKAIAAAANNNVDGVPLTLLASDIDIGYWDTSARTFTANGTPQNAIRVSGHRTAARGTGIPLLFAKAIGRNTCDINTTSIASMDGMPYALISLGTVNMSGTTMVQRKAGEDSSEPDSAEISSRKTNFFFNNDPPNAAGEMRIIEVADSFLNWRYNSTSNATRFFSNTVKSLSFGE